jgi:hypothetical protein
MERLKEIRGGLSLSSLLCLSQAWSRAGRVASRCFRVPIIIIISRRFPSSSFFLGHTSGGHFVDRMMVFIVIISRP